jgi:predicted DNA-binding transcriptional regulator YafY
LVQEAVWNEHRLWLVYHRSDGELTERVIEPYGLVAKASIWYVVASSNGEMRVSRISSAELLEEHFERPNAFDLVSYWNEWSTQFEASLYRYPAKLRVSPDGIPLLPLLFSDGVRELIKQAAPPDTEGWITFSVNFESLPQARSRLLSFGTLVEVLEPQELRESLADIAARIATFYGR